LKDELTCLKTLNEFGLLFEIEESFLDDISAEYQLKSSEIRDADALSRLALILVTATLYSTSAAVSILIGSADCAICKSIGVGSFMPSLTEYAGSLSFACIHYRILFLPPYLRQPVPLPLLTRSKCVPKICQSIRNVKVI
jgi:hypothetical protein